MTKICTKCKTQKDLDDFHKNKNNPDGRSYQCKTCSIKRTMDWFLAQSPDVIKAINIRRYYRRYGMSRDEFLRRVDIQQNRCKVCGSHPRKGEQLCVDHDHACCPGKRSCGKCVRDLLCHRCNIILGMVNENSDLLEKLANYLTPSVV